MMRLPALRADDIAATPWPISTLQPECHLQCAKTRSLAPPHIRAGCSTARFRAHGCLPAQQTPAMPSRMLKSSQAAQKGPDARRRPTTAREAYSLYVERAGLTRVSSRGDAAAAQLEVRAPTKQMGLFQRPASYSGATQRNLAKT